MKLQGEHWTVRAMDLYDVTDYHDCFVRELRMNLFHRNLPEVPGRIFFFEDPETDSAWVVTVQAPDFVKPTMKVTEGEILIECQGYPVTYTACRAGECEKTCRALYRKLHGRKDLITMSNTWGDMNSRDNVYDAFVRGEVDTAAQLGVDIVQVDDGWQIAPEGSISQDENRRRSHTDDYWTLNTERFPAGMEGICDYARANGVQLGLWFAPDTSESFAKMERDLQILKTAYDKWGMRFFKLDFLMLLNHGECESFLSMLDRIKAFGPDADVELDVTNGVRLGYLCGAQHGILFVENRYVKRDYYPHRTLRNLWGLSRILPACRFQFELCNPDLAPDAHPGDPFAVEHYDMDYLFASVMVSNPLFWMEMQRLSEERKAQLQRVMPVWKQYRRELAAADVIPIGEEPSGRAMTGFCAVNGDDAYLVLLREGTARDTFTYALPVEVENLQILASNTDAALTAQKGGVTARLDAQRTYVFAKAKVK